MQGGECCDLNLAPLTQADHVAVKSMSFIRFDRRNRIADTEHGYFPTVRDDNCSYTGRPVISEDCD